MSAVSRILSYTKQIVFLAAYDVLEQEQCEYRRDENSGEIIADITVFGNKSEFSISVSKHRLGSRITVAVVSACEGLSEQGVSRAENYIADRVEQLLENELRMGGRLQAEQLRR